MSNCESENDDKYALKSYRDRSNVLSASDKYLARPSFDVTALQVTSLESRLNKPSSSIKHAKNPGQSNPKNQNLTPNAVLMTHKIHAVQVCVAAMRKKLGKPFGHRGE
jgi:hypothetical protein